MSRLHLEWTNEIQIDNKATELQYRDIFITEFNISFRKPKYDRCEVFSIYELRWNEELKLKMQANYNPHSLNKEAAGDPKNGEKDLAINNDDFMNVLLELQKVLIDPMSEVYDSLE